MNPIEDIKGRDQEHKDIFVEYKLMTMASLESTGKDTLPGNVIAKNLDSDPYKLHLSWTAPTNPPLKGYLVTANLDEQNVFEKQTKDLEIFIDGLRPSTEYICNVCCILGNNEKIALDNPAKATTADVSDTHKPQNLRPEVSERKIYLTWDPKYIDENLHYECKIENMNTNKDILCTVLTQTSAQALGLQRGSYRAEVMTFVDKKKLASNCIENITINRAPKNISTEQMFVGHNNNRCNVKWDLPDLNEEKDNFECIGTAANLSLKEKGEWKNAKEIFSTDNNTAMFDQLSDRKQYQVELVTTYEDTDTRKEYKSSRTEQFNTVDWKMKTTCSEEGAKCKWKACYQYEDYKLLFRVGDSHYGPFEAQKCKRGKFYKYHFDSKEFQIQTKTFQVKVECNNGQIKSGFMEQNIDKKHPEVQIKAEANGFNPQQIDIRRVSSKVPQKMEVKVSRRGNDTPFRSRPNMDGTVMVDGLEPNTEYTCEAAFHFKKYGIINSNCCTVTTLPENDFLPVSITANKDNFNPYLLTLQWEPPEKKPDRYISRIFDKGEEVGKVKTSECRCSFSHLTPSTEYECSVACELPNGGWISTRRISNAITSSSKDTLPGNITGKSLDSDPYKLNLSWTAPTNPPQKGYLVTANLEEQNVFEKQTKDLQILIDGLQPSTEYICNVYCILENNVKIASDNPAKATTADVWDTHKPQNLRPEVSERKLYLTWEPPKYMPVDENLHYECKIEKMSTNNVIPCTAPTQTSAQALGLQRGSYRAEVMTFVDKKKLASNCIENIAINPKRNEKFDITQSGAAEAISTKPKFVGHNNNRCTVKWDLPDLKHEKDNFECIGTAANLSVRDKGEWMTLNGIPFTKNNTAMFDQLSDGKQYQVELVTTYEDIDTREEYKSSRTEQFNTDIPEPRDIEIAWDKNNLNIKWKSSAAIATYEICILNSATKDILLKEKSNSAFCYVQMKTGYSHGNVCDFEIHAAVKECKAIGYSQMILIGGDYCASEVKLCLDENDKKRKAILSWKQPKIIPLQYTIYRQQLKNGEKQDGKLVEILQTQNQQCSIQHLKPSTSYYCVVHPDYMDSSSVNYGSLSNIVRTEKKKDYCEEKSSTYGKPTIKTDILENDDRKLHAKISWSAVALTENHAFQHFKINLVNVGLFHNRTILDEIRNSEGHVEKIIESGKKYRFLITTSYYDIDTRAKYQTIVVEIIATEPQETTIQNCVCGSGEVTFSWSPVNGAASYILTVKDAMTEKIILEENAKANCKVTKRLMGDLRIGNMYSLQVTVVGEGGKSKTSNWKNQLFGGEKVPRNVQVKLNPENPYRSVTIKLDHPMFSTEPSFYEVRAVPSNAKEKKERFDSSTNITFKYLVQNTDYTFMVRAIYPDGMESQESMSEEITTKQKDAGKTAAASFSNIHNAEVNVGEVKVGAKITNINHDSTFGKILNLRVENLSSTDDDKDTIHLSWDAPTFQNRLDDYKIEYYDLVIAPAGTGEPYKEQIKFLEHEAILENGISYKLMISTLYEDIDRQIFVKSQAVEKDIYTRPKRPSGIRCNLIRNQDSNIGGGLKISWNAAEGVSEGYNVKIYLNESSKPKFNRNFQTENSWTANFEDDFGAGSKYKAKVEALGKNGLNNSAETPFAVIGGGKVPINVRASIDPVENPNNEALLEWDPPEEEIASYNVYAIEDKTSEKIPLAEKIELTENLCKGLKAGVEYRFVVEAVDKQGKLSVGCKSNKIKTDPKPGQVQNVVVEQDKSDPCTAIFIKWDKQNSEKSDENTIYKIEITTKVPHQFFEEQSAETNFTMKGLLSGQEYEVIVRGGNSDGFGRESDSKSVRTAYGKPDNLILKLKKKLPSSAMILSFGEARRNPSRYQVKLLKVLQTGNENVKESEGSECTMAFTGLQPNTIYMAEIKAFYEENYGPVVVSNKCCTAPPKGIVTSLKLTEDGDGFSSQKIQIKWKQVEKCDSHQIRIIRIKLNKTENTINVEHANNCTYVCEKSAEKYAVQVRSKNDSGYFGEWSDKSHIDLAPSKIEYVKVEHAVESHDIQVKWETPHESVDHYILEAICKTDESIKLHQVTKETHFNDNTILSSSTEYYFRVFPVKMIAIMGEHSRQESIQGKSCASSCIYTKPIKGRIKQAGRFPDSSSSNIKITWSDDGKCDMCQVHIKGSTAELTHNIESVPEKSFVLNWGYPGDSCIIRVRNIYKELAGDWSSEKTVQLLPAPVKWESTKLHGRNEMQMVWKKPVIMPNNYKIILYKNNETIENETRPSDICSMTFDNLDPGCQYHCEISAVNDAGDGKVTKSEVLKTAWTCPNWVESAIQTERHKIRLKWHKPPGVDCFKVVTENEERQSAEVITDEDKHEFHATPGSTYQIRVYSGCDGNFDTSFKAETVTMPPPHPTDVEVCASSNSGFIVKFKSQISKRVEHKIIVQSVDDDKKRKEITSNQCSAAVEDLSPGHPYKIHVTSKVLDKESEKANYPRTVHTLPHRIPKPMATVNHNSIDFMWEKYEKEFVHYEINLICGNDKSQTICTKVPSFTLHNPKPAQNHRLQVAVVNSSGCGEMSEWEIATAYPSQPEKIMIQRTDVTDILVEVKTRDWNQQSFRIVAQPATNDHEVFLKTTQTETVLHGLWPNNSYKVYVQCINNKKDSHKTYYREVVKTDINPPKNVRVTKNPKNPTSSLIVTFEDDEKFPSKKYLIEVTGKESKQHDRIETENFREIVKDLKPGVTHTISVQSQFQNIYSDKIFPDASN